MVTKDKKVLKLIKGTKGRIFTVWFIKRTTGELRKMNCRTGVAIGIKGTGLSYNPARHGLKVVYDMQKEEYRMINLEGVKKIKFNHKTRRF